METRKTISHPETPQERIEDARAERFRRPGFEIMAVESGSAAEKAGLKPGDVIIAYDGKDPSSRKAYHEYAAGLAGGSVSFTVKRNFSEITLAITPEFSPEDGRPLMGFDFSETVVPLEKIEAVEIEGKVVERHSGGYVDKDGNLICRYSYDLDPQPESRAYLRPTHPAVGGDDEPREFKRGPAYRLKSYMLIPARPDNAPIDLLEDFNPEKMPAYLVPGMGGGIYDRNAEEVQVQTMTGTPVDAHILLHELRHTGQDKDPKLQKLSGMSLHAFQVETRWFHLDVSFDDAPQERLERAVSTICDQLVSINEAAGLHDEAIDISGLKERFKEHLLPLYEEEDRLTKAPTEDTEALEAVQARIQGRHQDVLGWETSPGVSVYDILLMPKRVIERDAEFGALTSMRKIRKEKGIDLFVEFDSAQAYQMHLLLEQEGGPDALAAIYSRRKSLLGPDERARIEKLLGEMGRERFGSKVIDAVRQYMMGIGATAVQIRAHKEAAAKDTLA